MKPLILALAASTAMAASYQFQFSMDPSVVETMDFRGETVVFIPGGAMAFENGMPALPSLSRNFAIPQGETLEDVGVEILSTVDMGSFMIAPAFTGVLTEQLPAVLEKSPVYWGTSLFPENPVTGFDTGSKTGFRVASFEFTPFVWNPVDGSLTLITSAVFTAVTGNDPDVERLALSPRQVETAVRSLSSVVDNPEMLAGFAPATRDTDGPVWVVIADESHESIVTPLVDHRMSTHGSAALRTLQWIYANYEGPDTQAQIRNYLVDAFQNQGLVYALIVGDFGETNRVSSLTISGNVLNSTADLYYSDLDGTWDGNGNGLYGELTDGIDYYSDIYVGRFSADNPTWITTMVNKTIAYETTAPQGAWRTTALLAGAGLWPEYGYWGSFICDTIDVRIPDSWIVHKLYETYSSHPNNQIELMNQGVSFVGPHGHGFNNGIFWYYNEPTDIISSANYTGLTNIDMLPVFHSIACLAGKLSSPAACIAERLMFWPSGGGIAVMFNSDNGYGSPPNMGASEWLELFFADQLWVYNQNEIGVTQALAKDEFRAGPAVPMKLWVIQENNLLGDPALLFAPAQLGVEEEEGSGQASGPVLGAPSPNPARNGATVTLAMPAPGTATLTLFDISGRAVRTVAEESLSRGVHSFGIDTAGLPAGYYRILARTGSGADTASLVILP